MGFIRDPARMNRAVLLVSFAALLHVGCGESLPSSPDGRSGASVDASSSDAEQGLPTEFGGDRPVTLDVPTSYTGDTAMPLVLALHGFFDSPDYIVPLLGIAEWYEDKGFLFIAPDGLADIDGNHHWNATDACCDFYDTGTDDSAYLAGLITDISASYNVDSDRVYIIGHSNGGFMAHRMACDHADKIAAIVSFAGATFDSPADCEPSEPVSVAQLHGTADTTILYNGGTLTQVNQDVVRYPSAAASIASWADRNGCDAETAEAPNLDISSASGAESVVARHTGCPTGAETVLWTMPDVGHVTGLSDQGRDVLWQWFQDHAKH